MHKFTFLVFVCLLAVAPGVLAAETAVRPNILWITSEDNSSHWLGCYGNKLSKTPRLDALAKEGVLFENAYANAPVCAVSRATILNGVYSPTMGTQHMRSRHPIPARYRPGVEYFARRGLLLYEQQQDRLQLRGQGRVVLGRILEQGALQESTRGKPFFAIFNTTISHESSLFNKAAAEPRRVKPEEVELPPYLPDLPEVRKDYARYLDRIEDMDAQVGKVLDELAKAGLAEDTIVFYYADHGGILPRGKRYLNKRASRFRLSSAFRKSFATSRRSSRPARDRTGVVHRSGADADVVDGDRSPQADARPGVSGEQARRTGRG